MIKRRGFGVLWSANSLSNLADGLAFISMPLLAASMTDDPRLVAGLASMYALIRLLVALPIGVWVDRLDRRSLMVGANLIRGGALLALAVTIQLDVAGLTALYAVMAVVGTLESLADNAAVAILPSLVKKEELDSANSRITGVQLVADEFVGPPLGGFLFGLAAALPVFAMGGLWAGAGAIALAIPVRQIPQGPEAPTIRRRSIWTEAGEGIRWLAHNKTVGALAAIGALASLGYMLAFSILVLFAQHNLGLTSTGYGFLLSFSALGGLVGSALASKIRRALGYRWTISASLFLGAISLAGLAMTSHPVLAGVLLAVYIFHAVVWSICAVSLRQQLVPDHLLGRVGGATKVLGLSGLALGAALGGALGAINLIIPIAVGAAIFAVCCLGAILTLNHRDLVAE